ncbi:MAG TPA: hypothetical protein VF636_07665 [Sphingomonas sp.]|jgi:hypothetical protein
MRVLNIDWSGDAIYLAGFIVLLLVVAVLLERVSPTRGKGKHRSRHHGRKNEGDLI